jgi:transcriptional regulator with XRE-family HTH domain
VIATVAGVKLAQCRKRRYFSQRGLAAEAGVSFATVKAIESGRVRAPQLRVVRSIAETLAIDPAEIDEFRESLGLPPAPAQG